VGGIKITEEETITTLRNFLSSAGITEPKVIWDIGSRDGREAQSLSEAFPQSQIIAIEPNPETFPLVKKTASTNHNIDAKNIAISNLNGFVDFYKINTAKTITTWPDGNPGASSLLISNGKYPFEKYVQELVQVQSLRAAEMILYQPEIQPQLLWIDVQGAENTVLMSFDSYINEVTAIVVELSLQEMYFKQPLAQQVIDGLEAHFYFVKVLNTGSWQFDALLVNKLAPHKFRHWIRHKFFKTSLKTKRKFGIARNFPGFSQVVKSRLILFSNFTVAKSILHIKRKKRHHPSFIIDIFFNLTKSNSKTLASYSRMLAEALLPSNPLNAGKILPEISVLIPAISKDFGTINLVIEKILETSLNPISTVTVVYAGEEPQFINFPNVLVRFVHESNVIPSYIEEAIQRYPRKRQGWVRQQVIKFFVTGNNDAKATLICDSDTFLCEKRLWLNELGVQQLQISHEYSTVYEEHFLESFREQPNGSRRISFVTHHQLMQKNIIHEMFGEDLSGLVNWLELGNVAEISPISEYHSYGRFISSRHPDKCQLSRWNNLFIDARGEDVKKIIDLHGIEYSSISAHRY
jgi:FkbM family methyltransferase